MNNNHLDILNKGIEYWNRWRKDNPLIVPDLSHGEFYRGWFVDGNFDNCNLEWAGFGEATIGGCTFRNATLTNTNFMRATLAYANFEGAKFDYTTLPANFQNANLQNANLENTNLSNLSLAGANLKDANLKKCNLEDANLQHTNLNATILDDAILKNTDLQGAQLIDTSISNARFVNCKIRGISVWNLQGEAKEISNLIISSDSDSLITTDSLEIAQFINLLLNNKNITHVIDTIGSKGVLILGRFTEERKKILDALRKALKEKNYVPMIFDFDKPADRTLTETIKILAGLSKFVIVDITNPKSSPLEMQATVPDYKIPFIPIIQENEEPFSMFKDLHLSYNWVAEPLEYESKEDLLEDLEEEIVQEANRILDKIRLTKNEKLKTRKTKRSKNK